MDFSKAAGSRSNASVAVIHGVLLDTIRFLRKKKTQAVKMGLESFSILEFNNTQTLVIITDVTRSSKTSSFRRKPTSTQGKYLFTFRRLLHDSTSHVSRICIDGRMAGFLPDLLLHGVSQPHTGCDGCSGCSPDDGATHETLAHAETCRQTNPYDLKRMILEMRCLRSERDII